MFGSLKYCSRYDYTQIQLNTPLTLPDNGAHQQKRVINLRSTTGVLILIGTKDISK